MGSITDWELWSQEAMTERRKCKRVPLAFPIEVCGFDRTGHLFSERTATYNISDSGCRFPIQTQLERGDVVAIRLLSRQSEPSAQSKALLFQVVWAAREADGWMVGTLQLQPDNIWHVAFPPRNPPNSSSE